MGGPEMVDTGEWEVKRAFEDFGLFFQTGKAMADLTDHDRFVGGLVDYLNKDSGSTRPFSVRSKSRSKLTILRLCFSAVAYW